MRAKLVLLTAAIAFGFGTAAAIAEDAPGAKSDITIAAESPSGTDVPGTPLEEKGDAKNPGALSAPEKEATGTAPSGGGMSDESAANVPGASAEGDASTENPGALSSPEKDAMGKGTGAKGAMSDESAANVPGSSAEGDASSENPGALSSPEKE
jgi:hypothetical protein